MELNRSILVIGAGGFIGKKLVHKLVSNSYFVICLGRNEIPVEFKILSEFNLIKWVKGSYADIKLIDKLLNDVSIVFHLASATLPKSSNDNPKYDAECNLLPSISLISLLP
jgi:UDP-glucose 4-epimerase